MHKSFHPTIRDGSTWSKFGARGEHGDVLRFSNLGVLWFWENRALSVAVKYSVKSSVESLINRYEVRFGPGRQLDQENAHMEMYTAENGPILVQVLSYPILPILSYPCSG